MFIKLFCKYYQRIRILIFKGLSTLVSQSFQPNCIQPLLLCGDGDIDFGKDVTIGYYPSPFFYSTYAHLEAREKTAKIIIGSNVFINNNLCIIAEKGEIKIGNDVLIGCNVEILDSDFHELDPNNRNSGKHLSKNIIIENNVFIGNGVKILKGTCIGKNSVIAAGSVVTKSFEANSIIGGNPAVFIKKLL